MLGKADAVPNVAVKDIDRARQFYTDKLGLEPAGGEGDEMVTMKSGQSMLNIYKSEFAGTNKATAVTWSVPDIAEEVRSLKDKGIMFEHYDMPGLKLDGDIHVAGEMKVAWFKDPDGNILNLVEE